MAFFNNLSTLFSAKTKSKVKKSPVVVDKITKGNLAKTVATSHQPVVRKKNLPAVMVGTTGQATLDNLVRNAQAQAKEIVVEAKAQALNIRTKAEAQASQVLKQAEEQQRLIAQKLDRIDLRLEQKIGRAHV